MINDPCLCEDKTDINSLNVFNKQQTCSTKESSDSDIHENEDMQCFEEIMKKPVEEVSTEIQNLDRLKEFKHKHDHFRQSGFLYCQQLKDS